VILFIILALTGIIPVVFLGEQISGLLLIIHVTIAPFFAVALMLTAIFWAHFQQFDHSDFIYVKYLRIKKEGQNPDIGVFLAVFNILGTDNFIYDIQHVSLFRN
jgi:hypothetical protein